ncbi:MAG: pyridoxal phosphate-dependent decarboxylase family protein [bacterium]
MKKPVVDACFLGAYGENDEVVEKFMTEFLRDHVYWRRNFHPEDTPPISTFARYNPDYQAFLARMDQELHRLSADLKKSVPFYNPRYIGHMVSDLLLPGLLAQMMTILYNPNNIVAESGPVTVAMEFKVGRQLARMFGMNVDKTDQSIAWGHLTSGGTVANYESLWLLRALKYMPLSVRQAQLDLGKKGPFMEPFDCFLTECTSQQLMMLSPRQGLKLMEQFSNDLNQMERKEYNKTREAVEKWRFESMGAIEFFQHFQVQSPLVMVPITAHYSWQKAMKLLGIGTANLRKIHTRRNMRMNPDSLREQLNLAQAQERSVLAVVGVLGTTEFGTVDPIDDIMQIRDEYEQKGLGFGVHVDAAWGGYLAAVFRGEDNQLLSRKKVGKKLNHFPSDEVYRSFAALEKVDSITVDPHKLGYLPYGAGALVVKDRSILDLVSQGAAYVFDIKQNQDESRYEALGQFILEGSKPGAHAAACYVTHKVLPLNYRGMGHLQHQTIHATEYFYSQVKKLAAKLRDSVHLLVPFEPDCNLVCLAFNPINNRSLGKMNEFTRKAFAALKVDPNSPLQNKQFIGSYTSIFRKNLADDSAQNLMSELDLDARTFQMDWNGSAATADHIYVFRHTLMNPWLERGNGQDNYIDKYLKYLESRLLECLSS